jgi:hypothetical protein
MLGVLTLAIEWIEAESVYFLREKERERPIGSSLYCTVTV